MATGAEWTAGRAFYRLVSPGRVKVAAGGAAMIRPRERA